MSFSEWFRRAGYSDITDPDQSTNIQLLYLYLCQTIHNVVSCTPGGTCVKVHPTEERSGVFLSPARKTSCYDQSKTWLKRELSYFFKNLPDISLISWEIVLIYENCHMSPLMRQQGFEASVVDAGRIVLTVAITRLRLIALGLRLELWKWLPLWFLSAFQTSAVVNSMFDADRKSLNKEQNWVTECLRSHSHWEAWTKEHIGPVTWVYWRGRLRRARLMASTLSWHIKF